MVAELVSWLCENSWVQDLFYLLLDDAPVAQSGQVAKFDHHDDTGSWALDLAQNEFAELQAAWKEHSLPKDLFYPEGNAFCLPYPGGGLKAWLLRSAGVKKCYTPRQWDNEAGRIA